MLAYSLSHKTNVNHGVKINKKTQMSFFKNNLSYENKK